MAKDSPSKADVKAVESAAARVSPKGTLAKAVPTPPERAARDALTAQIADAQRTGDMVEVILAHHWPDPQTGENHLPESPVVVDADTAAGMAAAGTLLRGSVARAVPAEDTTEQ